MSKERTENDLLRVKKIFDGFSVPLILGKGVLLGVIRENQILPWDSDIDLFILASNPYENIVRAVNLMNKSGFEFWETYKTPKGKIIHWSFAPTHGNTPACIKMLYLSKDSRFLMETGIALGKRKATITLLPTRLFNPPKEITFLGQKFLVPNPPEEYLSKNYGENWRTPIKDGGWKRGRKWKIRFANECEESPWSKIIRENAPERIKHLQIHEGF